MTNDQLEKVVEVLNLINKKEPEAIFDILYFQKPITSEEIIEHRSIQVGENPDGKCYISILGILNGILLEAGGKKIAALIEKDAIIGFKILEK